ncbi:ParB/RepB/Spo0J family partition protein [Nocardia sp. XZ_19_369]|uniref:ParB/RepB/Spo0J family partition protein n=1 Tax=Nocardia sp. XZ_19_369 TaxID=2769487 RepID=UPI001E5EA059|nr:ParB/RepB/Spo0J family partition protein [Nocardia sp. XZ_19_369]
MTLDDRVDVAGASEWLSRMASVPVEQVPVALISPGNSPRVNTGTKDDHIRLLAEAPTPLPAIIVHRPTMRVIDGAHRLAAALGLGHETIAVKFFDGSEDDAFVLAVHANVAHGLPLSLAERKAAARRLVLSHPQWSDRLIADITGLSHKTVGAERRRSAGENAHVNSRVGKDGKVHRREVSEGRGIAAEMIKSKPDASLREISRLAGISVGTAKDVRDRLIRADAVLRCRQGGNRPTPLTPTITTAPDDTAETVAPRGVSELADRAGFSAAAPVQELILRSLRNDPALRFNDKGRTLLRQLASSIMDIRAWGQLTTAAPNHCFDSLARLARANARSWHELADQLENSPASRPPAADARRLG